MKTFFILIFLIIILFVGFYFWASQTSLKSGWALGKIDSHKEASVETKSKLKIMSWNMSYAHGVGSEGNGYIKHPKEHYEKNLKLISDFVRESDVDILLLQEIDFDSSRTYSVDQAKKISELTGLKHIAYAPTWDNQYIPFPYFPVSNQFGKMNSGGAIISRYPIVDNQVFLFDKPAANPFWYNAFYLFRFFQASKIEVGGKSFYVGNLHIEAFDKAARMKEAKKITELKNELTSAPWLLVGGDFNSTPAYASSRSNFEGYPEDDYEEDDTLKIFNESFKDLKEVLSEEEYLRDEKSWFTFPTNSPQRRLDYLYVNEGVSVLDKSVGSSTISDHFPLIIEIDINSVLQ